MSNTIISFTLYTYYIFVFLKEHRLQGTHPVIDAEQCFFFFLNPGWCVGCAFHTRISMFSTTTTITKNTQKTYHFQESVPEFVHHTKKKLRECLTVNCTFARRFYAMKNIKSLTVILVLALSKSFSSNP